MVHFYEYLEFNSDEDRENQLEVYVDVKLDPQTEEKIRAGGIGGDWLIMAEPYNPDCVEVVAYFQRMSKLNPNINVKYVSQKNHQDRKYFTSDEQQKTVTATEKMPSIFKLGKGKTELVLSEFPQFLKDKMAQSPQQLDELKADFRMGKFGKAVEAELLALLTE